MNSHSEIGQIPYYGSLDSLENDSFSSRSSAIRSSLKAATPRARALLPILDGSILCLAVLLIMILFESSFDSITFFEKCVYLVSSVGITLLCFYIFGLYDRTEVIGPLDAAYRLAKVVILASLLNGVVSITLGLGEFIGYTFLMFGILGWCILLRHLISQKVLPAVPVKRVLILGDSDESAEFAGCLARTENAYYELAGYLSMGIPDGIDEAAMLHSGDFLLEAADSVGAGVIALSDTVREEIAWEIHRCMARGIEVSPLHAICEKSLGRLPLSHGIFLQNNPGNRRTLYLMAKRLLDIIVSLLGMVFMAIIIVPVSAAIKATSPGPIFYSQCRSGRNGRHFMLYKFRTMHAAAEQGGPRWSDADDERVTAVGRFLRKTHLDEVPQYLNLLKGDLTLVGPRPERPEIISSLRQSIPAFECRHVIQPGITGWAQVCVPYAATVEDVKEKLQHDFFYIRNRCFFLDLVILLKTAKSIVQMRGH